MAPQEVVFSPSIEGAVDAPKLYARAQLPCRKRKKTTLKKFWPLGPWMLHPKSPGTARALKSFISFSSYATTLASSDIASCLSDRILVFEKIFRLTEVKAIVPSSLQVGAFIAGAFVYAFVGAICLERLATGRSSRQRYRYFSA